MFNLQRGKIVQVPTSNVKYHPVIALVRHSRSVAIGDGGRSSEAGEDDAAISKGFRDRFPPNEVRSVIPDIS